MTDFSYDDEIVDEEELSDDETNIYGEDPEGLSDGYGLPVEGSSYREEDDQEEYGDEDSSYSSSLKNTAAKYQDTIGTAVGGAAGGAILFGTPELALLTGGAMGAAHVAGVAGAKGMKGVKNFLDGKGEEKEEVEDEKYATA